MPTPLENKSTIAEIKRRFDNDVERFSNLASGQSAAMEAPLLMELITAAASRATPNIRRILDVGCGAGNNTLKLLQSVSPLDCDLVDLSASMLIRAIERIGQINTGQIRTFQGDFRTLDLPENHYDVILAAAVLHHLRDDDDWERSFAKLFRLTAPGGSIWITDLVKHETSAVQSMMWDCYGRYLVDLGGETYKNRVFDYIDREDSPRPATYQLELLKKVGFERVELLHKNACFAAFGAVKGQK
jgi:tRNA (cmo5U34)-methyltransferase